jgi:hypothetical protein
VTPPLRLWVLKHAEVGRQDFAPKEREILLCGGMLEHLRCVA